MAATWVKFQADHEDAYGKYSKGQVACLEGSERVARYKDKKIVVDATDAEVTKEETVKEETED